MSTFAMETHALTHCRLQTRGPGHRPPRQRSLAARITTYALAVAALALVLSGEHWLLEEAPPAVNELTAATCVIEDVYGAVMPAAVCTSHEENLTGNAL